MHLRIDIVEQAVRDAGVLAAGIGPAGYHVGYGLAEANLRNRLSVVADCCNPLGITREAWRRVADRAGVALLDVEIICSDAAEHRRRVEQRTADIPGFVLPEWSDVLGHCYEPWPARPLQIDTARHGIAECVRQIRAVL